MRVYRSADSFLRLPFAVVTSGTFDGVHAGHRRILDRVTEIARREGGESVVLTFWPHPRLVLKPEKQDLRLLNTFEEKVRLLEEAGIDHLLCIPFTQEFASVSSDTFIRDILVECIGTKRLVIGYDHRFGRNREGSFSELLTNGPAYGFTVEEIPRHDIEEAVVSSTAIRKFLEQGDMIKANQLLGRPYGFSGKVVHGEALGRKLGFPTANLDIAAAEPDAYAGLKLIPADGIYAVTAMVDGNLQAGMLYIGSRPTLGGTTQSIELNLFDFDGDLYGKTITVNLFEKTRGDIRFQSLDQLQVQLAEDRRATQESLRRLVS